MSASDQTERWQSLYDEALRQEEQAAETLAEEAQLRVKTQADAYRRRIDRIYADGTLFFRARIKNS